MVSSLVRNVVTPALSVCPIGVVLAILLLCARGAPPAQAETFCAPAPCAEGTEVATIEEAVAMAGAEAGPDTVAIQPGIHMTPLQGCGGLFVTKPDTHVRGAGVEQTILTFPPLDPGDGFTRNVICGHMHLLDLTLRLPSAVTPGKNSSVQGLDLYSGLVERVKVDAVGATFGPGINDGMARGMLLRKGAAREIEVDLDPALDTRGIRTGYLTALRDILVRTRGTALSSRVAQEPGEPPMRVSHAVLRSSNPLSVLNESGLDSEMELSDAVLDASGAPLEPTAGVAVSNGLQPETIALAMDRVTIVGNGAPESVAMRVSGQGGPKPTSLDARHVVAFGFAKTLRFGLFGSDVSAAIDFSNLDLSPAAIDQEGTEGSVLAAFGSGNRTGDPRFLAPASGDYRLAVSSAAIDIGGADSIAGDLTDLTGDPRPADGDGDGIALADAGAFEHQFQTPPPSVALAGPVDDGVKLVIRGKRLRLNRRDVVRLRLSCPRDELSPPCRGRVFLRTRGKVGFRGKRRRIVLARARFRIAAGRTMEVRLRGRKLSLVRRSRRARHAVAIVRVRDAAGNRSLARRGVVVIPRTRSQRRPGNS